MGHTQSCNPGELGAKSTAKEVVEKYGTGEYLKGKTAVVTGISVLYIIIIY